MGAARWHRPAVERLEKLRKEKERLAAKVHNLEEGFKRVYYDHDRFPEHGSYRFWLYGFELTSSD